MPELDMVMVHDLAEKIGKYGAERATPPPRRS